MAKHMQIHQRKMIKKHGFDQKWTLRKTDEEAGVTHAAVVNEIERNTPPGRPELHDPYEAQARYMKTMAEWGCTFNRRICAEIERRVRNHVYAKRISIEMRAMNPPMRVCKGTIYNYVKLDKAAGGDLDKYLPNAKIVNRRIIRRRGRMRRNRIPNAVCITRRPNFIDRRKRYGDLEIDLMAGRRGTGYLRVVVERKLR